MKILAIALSIEPKDFDRPIRTFAEAQGFEVAGLDLMFEDQARTKAIR